MVDPFKGRVACWSLVVDPVPYFGLARVGSQVPRDVGGDDLSTSTVGGVMVHSKGR